MWAVSASAYAPVTVTVDGVTRSIPMGTTAEELAASGLVKAPRGDLLSVTGEVAELEGGSIPVVLVDGEVAPPHARITVGSNVTSERGDDAVEAAITTITATPVPVLEEGRGPDTRLESIGAPGLSVVKVGVVSGSVVESTPLVAATPMRVKRMPLAPNTKVVALTFDDGPWPGQTERVLDILRQEGVHATFFMLGIRVRAHPDLAKRIVDEGHSVGSHTMTHPILTKVPGDVVRNQLVWSQDLIAQTTGVRPIFFRAPGGAVNSVVRSEANALGMRVVHWTADPADWRKPPASAIVDRVVSATGPGAIVLLHDGGGERSQTIAALPQIIHQLRQRGYRFITLDEMYDGQ